MSGFDKEAERERLREKYEQDQENRAATQRMSELLLKGATMTNSHCDACGDPIFRHDGQEFCPTCQAGGDATDAEASEEAAADSADSTADSPTPDAAETPDRSQPADASRARRAPPSVDAEDSSAPPADGRVRDLVDASADAPADASPDADSVGTARASLSRTLVRFSRAAEETDDPRRAAELLGAAREAAETLAALDTVR